MLEFLKQNWEGIVATVALLQIWVIKLYERYFRKPCLDIYPSQNPEIGYSDWGPTVGIFGTLRAPQEDVFVRQISIENPALEN